MAISMTTELMFVEDNSFSEEAESALAQIESIIAAGLIEPPYWGKGIQSISNIRS